MRRKNKNLAHLQRRTEAALKFVAVIHILLCQISKAFRDTSCDSPLETRQINLNRCLFTFCGNRSEVSPDVDAAHTRAGRASETHKGPESAAC